MLQQNAATLAGWTELSTPITFEHYEKWLSEGLHGDMQYLAEHASLKKKPASHLRSALSLAFHYVPHPKALETPLFAEGRVALYAQGEDYHHWLKQKLLAIAEGLQKLAPDSIFQTATDSSPVLERDLAVKAGLGWFGKNTCLIHQKQGSFLLLGEILTDLPVPKDGPLEFASGNPSPDFCGTCTRCLDVCPTQALIAPHKLDARLCISYLTIESRKVPDVELRSKIGDWLFGCDLCQTVCPWNRKTTSLLADAELNKQLRSYTQEGRAALVTELSFILQSSGKQIEKRLIGTPLKRAGPFGLRRNAMIVAGNLRLHELTEAISKFKSDEKLGDLADWALQEISK